jgi:serine/threonine protein kinase/tetratricopeptide (TPR) repeat protein
VLRSEKLVELATAIADGQHPDWAAAESTVADETERALIRDLRCASLVGRARADLYTSSVIGGVLAAGSPVESGATWGTLHIIEKVGRGRFGDVYRAWDPVLDREVALKLLRRRKSFVRSDDSDVVDEGRLMARVRHPNVATIYGAQTIDGVTGLWMEFVRGRTLEAELAARGRFAADELVHVGIELCQALKAIHGAGLVHRDIKAQNVMRHDSGRIVLGDFGTGRELDNVNGELAGTPLYIAPEIFAGHAAGSRSDVYSLGVLLYHLATGTFPVHGASIDFVRDAHRRGGRTMLKDARPDLPSALSSVIDRASSPDREMRFESASAFLSALDRNVRSRARLASGRRAGALAAIVLITSMASEWWLVASRTTATSAPQWILVSEFDNTTGDTRLNHALALALERELAQSPVLSVVPHERVVDSLRLMRRDPNSPIDPATAREVCLRDGQIGVFVSGRLDRIGKGYELDVTANDSRTGASIARAKVDIAGLDDVLNGLRTVTSRIRTALGESRGQVEADLRLEQVTTSSLDALRAYTTGVDFINGYRSAAAELPLRDAIRLDPSFSSAYIMLAHSLNNQGRAADEYLPFAKRALQQSANLPSREKYFIIGSYYGLIGDDESSIPAYEALVREHPTDYWGLNNLMEAYHETGRYREEIPFIPRIAALRPNDFWTTIHQAVVSIVSAGDVAQARALVDRGGFLQPPPMTPTTPPMTPTYEAWVAVFPAFELWTKRLVVEAAARLDTIAAATRSTDDMAAAIGLMDLALGRTSAAAYAFRTMSIGSDRQELLATVALARGDLEGAREAILIDANMLDAARPDPARGIRGKQTVALWVMIRAGLIKEAEAYAGRGMFDRDPTRWINAEQMAARGELDTAIPFLENVIAQLAPGNVQTIMAIDTLSNALIERGDLGAARRVLLSAGASTTYSSAGSRGYIWLRLRARLLWVERRLGHAAEAREIEQELQQLLQVADEDCRNTLKALADQP